ncbi:MAG TPA: branched-chain amino acid transporter [Gammaproteobacteria bacterium]|nr:branched-chain amino acid transporter [Gammaproteobacteria bacterium]
MNVWWLMILCGVLTFAIRLSFIAAEGKVTFPPGFRRLLAFVPVAALTALVIPELLMPQGTWWLAWDNARLVAGLAAIVIAAVTRSVLWTLIGGFAVLMVCA